METQEELRMANLFGNSGLRAILPLLAVAAAVASPRTSSAQEATVYAVAGADGNDTNILLAGATVRPSGLGLQPVVGLQAYRLGYDAGGTEGNTTVLAVTPSIGAEYRTTGGAIGGRVGYSFQDRDVDAPFIGGAGGRSGVVTTLQANSWAGNRELQGIASYNFGSDFLWSNAQVVLPVARAGFGNVGVGAEVVWEGEMDGGDGTEYRAFEVGPVVRVANGRNLAVTLGGGLKNSNLRDDTYYARLSVVRYGIEF